MCTCFFFLIKSKTIKSLVWNQHLHNSHYVIIVFVWQNAAKKLTCFFFLPGYRELLLSQATPALLHREGLQCLHEQPVAPPEDHQRSGQLFPQHDQGLAIMCKWGHLVIAFISVAQTDQLTICNVRFNTTDVENSSCSSYNSVHKLILAQVWYCFYSNNQYRVLQIFHINKLLTLWC